MMIHPVGQDAIVRATGSNWMLGRFGYTRKDSAGKPKMHRGVDWSVPLFTPVYAAHDGSILLCGWEVGRRGPRNGGYGQRVTIKSHDGVETRYAHLSILVPFAAGMDVTAGEFIGQVGHSGNAEPGEEHLHFEVRIDGTPVNPLWWLGVNGEARGGVPMESG